MTGGRLFVISGPSGVGKGTVVSHLARMRPEIQVSVSATTRAPRAGEVDGVHYRFVSDREFDSLIRNDAFLEWAPIYDSHRSGTLLAPVLESLGRGLDTLLEIDLQGARSVRRKLPSAVLVFLSPPSQEELVRRLRARRTEPDSELERRLAAASEEIAAAVEFDHVVVNDEAERAAAQVAAIIDSYPPAAPPAPSHAEEPLQ